MRYPSLAFLLLALSAMPAFAADHVVEIKDMSFQPATVEIQAGDTVTFVNRDQTPHTATADAGAFDTGKIDPGAAVRVTIGSGGGLAYHCNFHTMMQGQIVAR